MRIRSAAVVFALAVAAALAANATASAATLSADRSCYAGNESMVFSGSGFTPYGLVSFSVGGQQLATVGADPDGELSLRVTAPSVAGRLRLRFVAKDRTRPSLRAAAVARITAMDVAIMPARNSSRLRVRAEGFMDVGALYAHVKRRGHARARNVRLGTPRGACGTLDVERDLFGAGGGHYTLQFDAVRRYFRDLSPSVVYRVAIYRPGIRAGRYSSAASGPSTTHTASDRPGGLPPLTPANPPRVIRLARLTTTSRFLSDPFATGRSSRH